MSFKTRSSVAAVAGLLNVLAKGGGRQPPSTEDESQPLAAEPTPGSALRRHATAVGDAPDRRGPRSSATRWRRPGDTRI
jgi:hypothetical protein